MRNFVSFAFFIFTSLTIFNVTKSNSNKDFDSYRPPVSSFRCEELLARRKENLGVKQKLTGLLERNSQLISLTPRERENSYRKLTFIRGEIKFKLEQRIFRLKSIEEKIVRSGCPGFLSTN